MTLYPASRSFAFSIAVAATLVAPAVAQSFTLYGEGCPNPAGVPALHANGVPALGQVMQYELTQVPPGSAAVLWLGQNRLAPPIDLAFVGAPGCEVLTLPDIAALSALTPNGAAAFDLQIPADPGLAGVSLESQWINLDLVSTTLSVSNGGTAVFDRLPPPMGPSVISLPATAAVGTTVSMRVRNVGTTNPDDLCIQILGAGPTGAVGRMLLRATSIVNDPITGEDVIDAVLMTAPRQGGQRGTLQMMRGTGAMAPPVGTGCLDAPLSSWAWSGFDLPGAGFAAPTGMTGIPPANTVNVSFVYDSLSNSLFVDIPPYPWAVSGLYPPASAITTDAHGDLSCTGGAPGGHFDHFIEAVTVRASCPAGITAQMFADEHAPQVQSAFDNVFGPGRLVVTSEPGARLRLTPSNPNCTLTGGGGSIVLTQ